MKFNINIRNWHINDIPELVKYANNKSVSDNLRDAFPFPYTKEDAKTFIKLTKKKDKTKLFYAIALDDKAIGGIGGHIMGDVYRKNVEIGYWLAQPYWGKGIVTYCLYKFIPFLFENFDIERIYAETFENNIGSHKALIKAGFIHEAVLRKNVIKNNSFLNTHVYSILKEEYLKFYKK